MWDSQRLAPVCRCHSLHLSPEFMFFSLHPLTHPFPKNRFLGSPNECVSDCSLWTDSKSKGICWKSTHLSRIPNIPSQTLERGPGIGGSLSPKGEKNLSFSYSERSEQGSQKSTDQVEKVFLSLNSAKLLGEVARAERGNFL